MGIYRSAIVGLSYERDRAAAAARLVAGQAVDLVRDHGNDHDPNAVAVYSGSAMLGFIPARHAVWVAEIIDRGGAVAARVTAVELSGWMWQQADAVDLELHTGADALDPVSRAERIARHEASETYREAWAAAKHGLQVLRWLGEIGSTAVDRQRYVMDSYIQARAVDRGLTVTSAISERLRDAVMAMSGARSTAMNAARKLAGEDDDVEALAPCVAAIVKADERFSPEESQAVQALLKTLRRSRERKSQA